MDQAEQLRNIIKSNQIKQKTNTRVITITSGKGGVGKSNIAINLGIQLMHMGMRVILFDADFGLANIEVMFGAIPKYNLKDVIEGRKKLTEIITDGPEGIRFISGGSGVEGLANLSKIQLSNLLRGMSELDELADVVIIDTGAGISDSVLEFVAAGSEVFLVTTPEPTSVTDSYSLLKALHNYGGFSKEHTQIKLIANKVPNSAEGKLLHEKLNVVSEKFLGMSIGFLGAIPTDEHVIKAIMKQSPVSMSFPNAKSVKAFEKIAGELTATESNGKKSLAEMFSRYFSRRRDKWG